MIQYFSYSLFFICALACLQSCSSTKRLAKDSKEDITLQQLSDRIQSFNQDNQVLAGIVIKQVGSQNPIFAQHEDKFFIPASNTKLLTLLAAKSILGDSIHAYDYIETGDSLLIRGVADPTFLSVYDADSVLYHHLVNSDKSIYVVEPSAGARFGQGWSWDDYSYYYQKEISSFPLAGNGTRILFHPDSIKLRVIPEYMRQFIEIDPSLNTFLKRDETSNTIKINPLRKPKIEREYEIPFYQVDDMTAVLLGELVKKNVKRIRNDSIADRFISVYHNRADSLYRHLMTNSDNFIADQLLMQISETALDTFHTKLAIRYILDTIFADMPDKPRWVDGSGLSRYNLISPRSIIWVLEKILKTLTEEEIKAWFLSSLDDGTLPEEFKGLNLFAKTGSLSNNFCLSGYLHADSGKVYLFSWMSNHYMISYTAMKSKMAKILSFVQQNF